MPLPLIPIFAGKAIIAGGIALYGHRFARRLQTPAHYAAVEPVFVPHTMLNGDWRLEGLAHGPRGRVATRLTGTLSGTWSGPTEGDIAVDVHTDAGEVWQHTLAVRGTQADGLALSAAGLEKPATGVLSGNSLRLRYSLVLPKSLGGWRLDAEDWIFALPSGTLAYQGQYHKLGWPVGSFSGMLTPKTAAP